VAALCKTTLVFCLPGSTGAIRLALEKILLPQLDSRTRPCNFVELLPRVKGTAPG
jgi:molybdenum cofactor biosynthesis protein B